LLCLGILQHTFKNCLQVYSRFYSLWTSGVRRGVQGVQQHTQKFGFGENPAKIP